jgi:hypothetical protein
MKKIYFPVISILLISLFACKRTSDPTPFPIVDGDIKGAVNLYDEGKTSLSNEGMTIAVEESVPFRSAISEASGEFLIQEVEFGTFTLACSKEGYGTYKLFNVEHANTGWTTTLNKVPDLGKRSSTAITELSAEIEGNNVRLTITTDPPATDQNRKYLRLFYDDQFNISNTNYDDFSDIIEIGVNPFEMILTNTNLNNAGYASGSTVFLRVYGESFYSNEYDDPDLGYRVFPNVNPNAAAAVSVVVP